jgi:integrase
LSALPNDVPRKPSRRRSSDLRGRRPEVSLGAGTGRPGPGAPADYRLRVARVGALRLFFNDAMTPQAGRLAVLNPFARLGLKRSSGRRHIQPPTQVDAARLIALADDLTPPTFAAYLQFAIHEGTRPGETDGLRCDQLDFEAGTIRIDQQRNVKVRKFTLPKHGFVRTIAMTDPARERLLTLPLDGEFVFATLRGHPSFHAPACARRSPSSRRCGAKFHDRRRGTD